MAEYEFIRVEELDDGSIVRILLNRHEVRNAQKRGLMVELDDAFIRAETDDRVRVVILGGVGPLFSAGHDIKHHHNDSGQVAEHPSRSINGGARLGAEARTLQEWHYFFRQCGF